MPQAARLHDPIGHSPTMNWLLGGIALGAAIGLATVAIVGTGGLAAVAIVGGLAAGGGGIAEVLSTMSGVAKEVTGKIAGPCSGNVYTNGKRAARAHVDMVACTKHPPVPLPIATGSGNVYINGQPAARVGDTIACSAVITDGSSDVYIGGGSQRTDPISPENLVPPLVHTAMLVVGIGAAVVLAGPIVAVAGLALGAGGGALGSWAGGKIFGEGSDGQKLSMLGGSLIGGMLGSKGGSVLAGKLLPKPTTPVGGFVKGGMPGMKEAAGNQAAAARAAAQDRLDKSLDAKKPATDTKGVPAAPPEPPPRFPLEKPMSKKYEGEETGSVWGSKVKYLNDAERLEHQLHFKDGKLYDSKGQLFDTRSATTFTGDPKAIYVMDKTGAVYASKYQAVGEFHHSSLLAGKPVAAAGEIAVHNGVVTEVNMRSGHYMPSAKQFDQFLLNLKQNGVHVDPSNIKAGF